jgi:hypothetical protein
MADDVVTVKDPSGELGTLPKSELPSALRRGFTVPPNAEIVDHNNKLEFGSGIGNSAKAFGEAALGTATFGLSRELENAAGITTPMAQAARAKYNPVARTAGDIIGVAAPLLLTEGTSALNPVAKVSQLGLQAGEAATALAPEGGLLTSAIRAGTQGATEGAFYGAGQTVTEHALGDPDVNAEKLLHNIGFSALLGGGIGAGFGSAEYLVPKAVGYAKEALDKARNSFFGGEEVGPLGKLYAKTSSFVSGKPEESILEAIKQRKDLIEDPVERERVAGDFADSLQDHFSNLNNALKSANNGARDEEIKSLLSEFPADQAKKQSADLWASVDKTVKEMTEHSPLYPQSVPYKLEGLRNEFITQAEKAETAADIYESINWLKGKIDEKFPIWGKNIPPEWKDAASLLKGLRTEIKNNLQNESIWGEAGARQSAFNDAQGQFLTVLNNRNAFSKAFLKKSVSRTGQIFAEVDPSKVKTFLSQAGTLRSEAKAMALDDFFKSSRGLLGELENTYKNAPTKTLDKDGLNNLIQRNAAIAEKAQSQAALQKNIGMLNAGGHNTYLGEGAALFAGVHNPALGAAIEVLNLWRNPGLAIQRLVKIEEAVRKTSEMIQTSSKALFKSSIKAGKMSSGYLSGRLTENHDKREERLMRFAANPVEAINHLGETTAGLYESAPQTTASLHSTALRASQFLVSKLPSRSQGPLDQKLPLSSSEISKFNRYYETVENPIGVLADARSGTITSEQMETLATVYPKLYEEMKSEVMESVAAHAEVIGRGESSYKTRLGIGLFLGEPIDLSMTPTSIMNAQTLFAVTPKSSGLQPKPSKTGMKDMTLASRTSLREEEEA